MKKILVSLVAMMFLVVPMAFAVTITIDGLTTDVGGIDTFIASTNDLGVNGSSETSEQYWVNMVLSPTTATFGVKSETVDYFATDTDNVLSFYLGAPEVDYFLLKNSTWWALFQNVDNMLWGVFNTNSLPAGMNLPNDDFEISHVTRFNAVQVPEPSTLLLFGAGIAGLAMYRRKRS